MSNYDNTNRGSVWKNERKETENHPDFTGSLNVEGVEYWVSGWKRKEGANPNAPALSFSIKAKEQNSQGMRNDQPHEGDDGDIPF
jgi:hypothetical protein